MEVLKQKIINSVVFRIFAAVAFIVMPLQFLSAPVASAAHAVHAAPLTVAPNAVYRWQDTHTGLCMYDRGLNNAYTMGGCTSAARFTRSDCGNRSGVYWCEYTDGSGNAITDSGDVMVAGHPVGATTQLLSDPLEPNHVLDYGAYGPVDLMSALSNGTVVLRDLGGGGDQGWALLPG